MNIFFLQIKREQNLLEIFMKMNTEGKDAKSKD